MMHKLGIIAAITLVTAGCDSAKRTAIGAPEPVTVQETDSAYRASVANDPIALAHHFLAQPDGGDIIVERGIHDDMGINQIRSHLLLISRSFARGDFAIPGFVHSGAVPGTDVMTQRAGDISYTVEDTEHGGMVHIRTSNPEALKAIHAFIDFQIAEHPPAEH